MAMLNIFLSAALAISIGLSLSAGVLTLFVTGQSEFGSVTYCANTVCDETTEFKSNWDTLYDASDEAVNPLVGTSMAALNFVAASVISGGIIANNIYRRSAGQALHIVVLVALITSAGFSFLFSSNFNKSVENKDYELKVSFTVNYPEDSTDSVDLTGRMEMFQTYLWVSFGLVLSSLVLQLLFLAETYIKCIANSARRTTVPGFSGIVVRNNLNDQTMLKMEMSDHDFKF